MRRSGWRRKPVKLRLKPMYLGMVLLLSGIAWFEGCVSPWSVVVAFGVLLDRTFVLREEQQLEETFGAPPMWPRTFPQTRAHDDSALCRTRGSGGARCS
jgi:hypothetical protein